MYKQNLFSFLVDLAQWPTQPLQGVLVIIIVAVAVICVQQSC